MPWIEPGLHEPEEDDIVSKPLRHICEMKSLVAGVRNVIDMIFHWEILVAKEITQIFYFDVTFGHRS